MYFLLQYVKIKISSCLAALNDSVSNAGMKVVWLKLDQKLQYCKSTSLFFFDSEGLIDETTPILAAWIIFPGTV